MVKTNSGNKPLKIADSLKDEISFIDKIKSAYQDHFSIKEISHDHLFLHRLIQMNFKSSLKMLYQKCYRF